MCSKYQHRGTSPLVWKPEVSPLEQCETPTSTECIWSPHLLPKVRSMGQAEVWETLLWFNDSLVDCDIWLIPKKHKNQQSFLPFSGIKGIILNHLNNSQHHCGKNIFAIKTYQKIIIINQYFLAFFPHKSVEQLQICSKRTSQSLSGFLHLKYKLNYLIYELFIIKKLQIWNIFHTINIWWMMASKFEQGTTFKTIKAYSTY